MKVGTQAAAVDATYEKLDNVPQATLPFSSVTAAAAKIFAVEYTRKAVGEALLPVSLCSASFFHEDLTLSRPQSSWAQIHQVSRYFEGKRRRDLDREKRDS